MKFIKTIKILGGFKMKVINTIPNYKNNTSRQTIINNVCLYLYKELNKKESSNKK